MELNTKCGYYLEDPSQGKTVAHSGAYPSQALNLRGSGSAWATSISAWLQPVGMTSLTPDINLNVDTHVRHTCIQQPISTHKQVIKFSLTIHADA